MPISCHRLYLQQRICLDMEGMQLEAPFPLVCPCRSLVHRVEQYRNTASGFPSAETKLEDIMQKHS